MTVTMLRPRTPRKYAARTPNRGGNEDRQDRRTPTIAASPRSHAAKMYEDRWWVITTPRARSANRTPVRNRAAPGGECARGGRGGHGGRQTVRRRPWRPHG